MRLAVALLLIASTAAAEPEAKPDAAALSVPNASDANFSFAWSAPPPCPTRAEVLARAERLIGHALTRAPGAQRVSLVGAIQALADANFELHAELGPRGEGERTVSASSCDELGDAMALFIALSVDPDYAARTSASPIAAGHATFADVPNAPPEDIPGFEPQTPARVEATPAEVHRVAPLPAAHAEEPRVRSTTNAHFSLGALGAVWAGRLPGVAPGAVLRGAVALDQWIVALEGGWFPPEHVVNQSLGADLSLLTVGGSLGYSLFDGLLTPYAGLELDRLHGRGTHVTEPASGTVWLLGFDGGLRFAYPVRASLRIVLGGHISILQEQARFHVEPNMELFRPERVGAEFGLGAELRVR